MKNNLHVVVAMALTITAGGAPAQTPSSIDRDAGRAESAPASSKGQAYPAKPVRFNIGFAPGGASDTMVRIIGGSPKQLGDYVRKEIPIWAKVIKDSSARVD